MDSQTAQSSHKEKIPSLFFSSSSSSLPLLFSFSFYPSMPPTLLLPQKLLQTVLNCKKSQEKELSQQPKVLVCTLFTQLVFLNPSLPEDNSTELNWTSNIEIVIQNDFLSALGFLFWTSLGIRLQYKECPLKKCYKSIQPIYPRSITGMSVALICTNTIGKVC